MTSAHEVPCRRAVCQIGLGELGLALATRLVSDGHTVLGYRRGDQTAFAAIGGLPHGTAADAARASDLVLMVLPDDPSLLEVMAAIAPVLRPGQIVVCLGSHREVAKRAAADMALSTGAILLDGEISGTPPMMLAGKASVMIAGDRSAFDQIAPLFEPITTATHYVGAFGNATKLKLVTNYLVGIHTFAAAEALSLASDLGLDVASALRTLSSSAGSSTMLVVRGPMMARRDYPDGSMSSFLRYFELLREALSDKPAIDRPLLDLTESAFREAAAQGQADLDIAAIFEAVRQRSS